MNNIEFKVEYKKLEKNFNKFISVCDDVISKISEYDFKSCSEAIDKIHKITENFENQYEKLDILCDANQSKLVFKLHDKVFYARRNTTDVLFAEQQRLFDIEVQKSKIWFEEFKRQESLKHPFKFTKKEQLK